jgi:hypothetical protein
MQMNKRDINKYTLRSSNYNHNIKNTDSINDGYLILIKAKVELNNQIFGRTRRYGKINFDRNTDRCLFLRIAARVQLKQLITRNKSIIMEITDNTFARQFETTVEELVSVEYSFRKKNIFNQN